MTFYFRILSFYLIMMTLIHNFEFFLMYYHKIMTHVGYFLLIQSSYFLKFFFPFSGRNWLLIKRRGNSTLLKDKLKSCYLSVYMGNYCHTNIFSTKANSIYLSFYGKLKMVKSRQYHGSLSCTQIELRSQPRPSREEKTYSALWDQLAKQWLTN